MQPNPDLTPATPDETQMPAPPPPPTTVNSSATIPATKKSNPLKKILIALIVILLLSGIGAGSYFFILPMLNKTSQVDCQTYTFYMDQTGEVTVTNNSGSESPPQSATVLIGESEAANLEVPIIYPNESTTIGVITTPTESFNWQIIGNQFCKNTGSIKVAPEITITAQCNIIKAYNKNWTLLTSNDLADLKSGDIIYFTVTGSASEGTFDLAQFTINQEVFPETSELKPETDELSQKYEIPEDISTFVVNARVHHLETDQWY